ncbi:hypothetical protein JW859_11195 [bacterium]|nr:hypothetical protein [bacterium]
MSALLTFVLTIFFVSTEMGSGLSMSTDATEVQKKACCGRGDSKKWTYLRVLDEEVVDSGCWSVNREGVCYLVAPSSSGNLLRMCALRLPSDENIPYDELDPNKRYFNGVNPEEGMIIAEAQSENEYWVFQIGDLVITDDEGFFPGSTDIISFNTTMEGKWDLDWKVGGANGFWLYQECSGQPVSLYGPPGTQWEEVDPDWQQPKWVQVPIPPEYGRFYGYAHAVGEVWTVTINGESYSATSDTCNPGCSPPLQ